MAALNPRRLSLKMPGEETMGSVIGVVNCDPAIASLLPLSLICMYTENAVQATETTTTTVTTASRIFLNADFKCPSLYHIGTFNDSVTSDCTQPMPIVALVNEHPASLREYEV